MKDKVQIRKTEGGFIVTPPVCEVTINEDGEGIEAQFVSGLQGGLVAEGENGLVISPPVCEMKITEGGAVQRRWRLPTGGKVSLSTAPKDGKFEKRGHFHRGLVEVYTVHAGQLEVFFQNSGSSDKRHTIISANETFIAHREVSHAIIMAPSSVFVTQTTGTPVPNPKRGNDWYLANDEFNEYVIAGLRVRGYNV